MQHWEITDKRIYQLLKHPYQIDKSIVEEMSSAYIEFMEDLFNFLNKTNDNKESEWKSPFYLNPDVVNSTDAMEVVSGFFHIENAIQRIDHKEVFFSDFAHAFGKFLNVDFGDVYKKETSVIRRKPNKKTEFLERLKASVIKKSNDEGYS